jgi:hypothetical protein
MSVYSLLFPVAARRIPPNLGTLGLLFAAGAAPVLAIPVQVFGLLPLTVTRWFVLALAAAAALLMTRPGGHSRWARRGLVAGMLAVTAYDAVRMPMASMGWWPDFIPRLGGWVLGTDAPNAAVGYTWRYLGDGGGMGLAFFVTCGLLTAVRPALVSRHPVALSVGYGVFVWTGLVGTIALSTEGASMLFALTPTSLVLSLVGHLTYGAGLGVCLRRATRAATSRPGRRPVSRSSRLYTAA